MKGAKSFNPRPRAGGDRKSIARHSKPSSFNPRPRAGGDRSSGFRQPTACGFNPRPRAGGDGGEAVRQDAFSGFNPRPRAGGDIGAGRPVPGCPVSIHAPVRGATPLTRLPRICHHANRRRPRAPFSGAWH